MRLASLISLLFALAAATAAAGCEDPREQLQPDLVDTDGDGIPDDSDNCPEIYNPDQADSVGDGVGDACRPLLAGVDNDNDVFPDHIDNCPNVYNPDQSDIDGDGIGDVCDDDLEIDCGLDKFMRPMVEPEAAASSGSTLTCLLCEVLDLPNLVAELPQLYATINQTLATLGHAWIRASYTSPLDVIDTPRLIAARITSDQRPTTRQLNAISLHTLLNGDEQEEFDAGAFAMRDAPGTSHGYLLIAYATLPFDSIELQNDVGLLAAFSELNVNWMCVGQALPDEVAGDFTDFF